MGSLPPPELSLDVRPAFVPKTIGDFLREVAAISDPSCRSSRLEDLVNSLEGEMKKIDAFKRELPLSMLLLHDAIITLKLELVQCTAPSTQPVLAELMPLTKGIDEIEKEGHEEKEGGAKDKMNWKSCLQLWTSSYNNSSAVQPVDPKQDVKAQTKGLEFSKYRTEAEDVPVKTCSSSSRSGVNNFMPLRGFSPSVFPSKEDKVELPIHGLSLLTTGSKAAKEQPVSGDVKNNCSRSIFQNLRSSQQQSSRKQRRCWSPELHRRFVNALQQLGGSQVATPKQIRELMQIDGLTNDEVKSHLQKYRLHTRKHPSSSSAINNDSKSSLALGGLWSSSQNKTESSFSKENDSSGSPEGPLQLCTTTASAGAASATGGESMEDDEEEDTTKSESYSWKNQIHRPRNV